ncbi:RidA family protein [Parasphingopyxis algicola]|uniref:RidA family protein n=1 Tax=Parasphingopyxis algicola TaxID=2026624 RepID=UPI0015A447D4|nr:RidA family protein [Parasphingopyxis algicola]QLC26447.1 RidA family protein [Parasphingopyxis algicola]
MHLERVHVSDDAERQLGFSQAVKVGETLWVSGAVSWDENLNPLHVGDMVGQMRQIYGALGELLKRFDRGMDAIVKETVFATDLDLALKNTEVRRDFFPDDKFPASTWVEVKRLAHPDLLLEVEIVAQL